MRAIAFDPAAEAAGEPAWLVLERRADLVELPDCPALFVRSTHATKAAAERAAELHESPVVAWLLYDEALGWRLLRGRGFVATPSYEGCHMGEDTARAILADEAGWRLMVLRRSGLVTEPDEPPTPTPIREAAHASL